MGAAEVCGEPGEESQEAPDECEAGCRRGANERLMAFDKLLKSCETVALA
jgi:hypothetical protein